MTADLAAIKLPDHVHAEILTARDAVTGNMVSRAVVWADRTYKMCGTCDEPVPVVPGCPVTISGGDGRGAQLAEWTQQHAMIGGSCGTWQPVLWAECGTSEDEITAAAAELAADRFSALGSSREQIAASLRAKLSDALANASGPAAEDRGGITTGSDEHPGIYFDQSGSGEWVAWDFDPDDADGCGTITVYASDLAA